MKKRRLFVITLSIGTILLIFGVSRYMTFIGKDGIGNIDSLNEYSSKYGGYSLLIPDTWIIKENNSKGNSLHFSQHSKSSGRLIAAFFVFFLCFDFFPNI